MNQCDGCMQGAALDGCFHRDKDGKAFMICQASKYPKQNGVKDMIEPNIWCHNVSGICPVPGETVMVKYRDGEVLGPFVANEEDDDSGRDASSGFWQLDDWDNDIVGYMVVPTGATEVIIPEDATDEFPLPKWATGYANDWFQQGAQLCTKDGRKVGNGVVLSVFEYEDDSKAVFYISDIGNHLILNEKELQELFYPPKYLMSVATHPGYLRRFDKEARGE